MGRDINMHTSAWFADRRPETLRADIDLCRRDIDHIGERLNKLERPATYTPEETFSRAVRGEHEAIVEYLMSEEDAATLPVQDKLKMTEQTEQEWRDALVEGDEVAHVNRDGVCIDRVWRTTKTQIIFANGRRYRRATGRVVGADWRSSRRIERPTEQTRAEVRKRRLVSQIRDLTTHSNLSAQSLETIEAVVIALVALLEHHQGREDERERCAKICDVIAADGSAIDHTERAEAAKECADTIREASDEAHSEPG